MGLFSTRSSPLQVDVSEQLYVYKKVALPNGKFGYERVPYNPHDEFLEPPTIVPRLAPMFKNGEFPGQGSMVVDRLLIQTREARSAQARKEFDEAVAAQMARQSPTKTKIESEEPTTELVHAPVRIIEP